MNVKKRAKREYSEAVMDRFNSDLAKWQGLISAAQFAALMGYHESWSYNVERRPITKKTMDEYMHNMDVAEAKLEKIFKR